MQTLPIGLRFKKIIDKLLDNGHIFIFNSPTHHIGLISHHSLKCELYTLIYNDNYFKTLKKLETNTCKVFFYTCICAYNIFFSFSGITYPPGLCILLLTQEENVEFLMKLIFPCQP